MKSLTEEQLELYEEYEDLESKIGGIGMETHFARGFRAGLHAGLECAAPKEFREDKDKLSADRANDRRDDKD